MTDEQKKICLRAIDHFGVEHQKEKAVEELLELGTEIMHDLDGRARMDAIREELADVIIMAEQLRIIYGCSEVDKWIDRKLVRLGYRLMPAQTEDGEHCSPLQTGGTYGNV